MEIITSNAPSLHAKITGELDQNAGLALYRGVTYASVSARWTHSVVKHTLDGNIMDATQFGPRCPQRTRAVLVSGGVADPSAGDDEFRCLNLNITTPIEAVLTQDKPQGPLLPVMVWIHGGAFAFGSNSIARYRPQSFSKQAKTLGQPVVLVPINYRLGALGFAASKDIAETGDTRIGNYGLDFGGDPSKITTYGVSAGSASIHHHLLSGVPLFDRAIMTSGAAPSLGPYTLENSWEKICDRYGLAHAAPAERLERLRNLEALELLEAYSTNIAGPVADGMILPTNWGFADPMPSARCKAIILGDTNAKSMIYRPLVQKLSQAYFHERVHACFSQPNVQDLHLLWL
ncbi:hypothetical protein N7520_002990 [Penicillium odoratum]|uniref:uncharacterized protein n=1 Tax=Penicillium odoratum TaxID=1167516 RepID=UPI002548EFC1|nr:uncharacterized protein N7520_002990 [Penicillium odoratum]KAJ5772461.1 hypothetical protein N7520_002990 [Penicillium odoratum]